MIVEMFRVAGCQVDRAEFRDGDGDDFDTLRVRLRGERGESVLLTLFIKPGQVLPGIVETVAEESEAEE